MIDKLYGGRGGMSSARGGKTGLFHGGGGGSSNTETLLPAEINRIRKTGDIQRLVNYFSEQHTGRSTEYAITIDKNGYATSYTHGGSGSVTPDSRHVPGSLVVHNHPRGGWANFSGEDLEYAAQTRATGIVATSQTVKAPKGASKTTKKAYAARKAGTYTFEKGGHFKAADFVKAIHNVKVSDTDYDRGLDRWLKANQKKYGYTYSYTPRS